VAPYILSWPGPQGGQIGVGFTDEHFSLAQMSAEIDFAREAYPNLPDEVPLGTSFVFAKERTGHFLARFKVGDTVYRDVVQGSLRRLWNRVDLIDQLLHPERYKIGS
jgi:hypothetical protein